jgi:aminomethyltransferase
MAYVDVSHTKNGQKLIAKVRGKDNLITISKMPFVPSNYYKKA